MVFAFDTLSYARHLRERGVPPDQAEAHAEAARTFIMAELVTKADLQVTKADLQTTVNSAVALLEAKIESQSLRLTIRLGGIVAVGIAILAAILKLG